MGGIDTFRDRGAMFPSLHALTMVQRELLPGSVDQ